MNFPRFSIITLPIIFSVVLAGFASFCILEIEGNAVTASHLFMFFRIILVLALLTSLVALGVRHLLKSTDRDIRLLEMRLETIDRRREIGETQAMVMNRVNDLHETFAVSRDLSIVLNQAVAALKDILKTEALVLQLYSDNENRFFMRIEEGGTDIDLGDELLQEVIEDGKSRLVNNLSLFPKYSKLTQAGFASLVVAPLNRIERGGRRKSIGLIAALTKQRRDFSSYELGLLTSYSRQTAMLIDNARLYKRVEALAIRDGLTNLFNHRHFQEVLEREVKNAERTGSPLGLIILDIDNFKKFNDTYGHPEGDRVLRTVADILLDNTRGKDVVARYGGEEFVIILPETSRQGAMTVAQTIRQKVESYSFSSHNPSQASIGMSITGGVALFPENARTAKELIVAADNALFLGKRNGKNQVVSAA